LALERLVLAINSKISLNRTNVILKEMNGKFKLLLDGHFTLEKMIHDHRAETNQDKQELLALIKTSHSSLHK
ncbi:MAG: hypothetical protein ACE5DY_08675, partial [Mariprofundaceae bacterium]